MYYGGTKKGRKEKKETEWNALRQIGFRNVNIEHWASDRVCVCLHFHSRRNNFIGNEISQNGIFSALCVVH